MALLSAYGDEDEDLDDLEEAQHKRGDGGGSPAPRARLGEAAEGDAARQGPSGGPGREAGGESVDLGGDGIGARRETLAQEASRGRRRRRPASGPRRRGSGRHRQCPCSLLLQVPWGHWTMATTLLTRTRTTFLEEASGPGRVSGMGLLRKGRPTSDAPGEGGRGP